jgi:hypothetical protein
MLTPAQIHWLTDGALDMGLLRPPVRERSLNVDVIRAEPSVLALPSGHRFADAAEVPLVAR